MLRVYLIQRQFKKGQIFKELHRCPFLTTEFDAFKTFEHCLNSALDMGKERAIRMLAPGGKQVAYRDLDQMRRNRRLTDRLVAECLWPLTPPVA